MLENLGFLLEAPIARSEARTRQLPQTVGKLVLYAVEKTKEMRATNMTRLARWLSRWVEAGESLYASPILSFLSEKKMAKFLASLDLEEETVQIDGQTYLIRCPSDNAIASILQHCTSEAIVFMTDTDGRSARETLDAVDKYPGKYQGYETPFMSRLDAHGEFFFFGSPPEKLLSLRA